MNTLNVREAQLKDIDLIENYWLSSIPDYLVSLGVDLNKLHVFNGFREILTKQINAQIDKKQSYALF